MFGWLEQWLLKRWMHKAVNNPANSRLKPECDFLLSIDNGVITNKRPEGKVEQVSISDLKSIIVETNDSGPWGMDVWWYLIGSDSGCVYPQGATGENEVLNAIQALPGFDNQALIQAMGCSENKRFQCWQSNS